MNMYNKTLDFKESFNLTSLEYTSRGTPLPPHFLLILKLIRAFL